MVSITLKFRKQLERSHESTLFSEPNASYIRPQHCVLGRISSLQLRILRKRVLPPRSPPQVPPSFKKLRDALRQSRTVCSLS